MSCPLCLEPGRELGDVCRKCMDTLATMDRRARGRVTGHALAEAFRAFALYGVSMAEVGTALRYATGKGAA